jgi:hypothetical protein
MNRRDFFRIAGAGTAATLLPECIEGANRKPSGITGLPKPTAPQLAWQQAEIGLVYHYDLHVFDGKRYSQGANRKSPITDVDMFNPQSVTSTRLNPASISAPAGTRIWVC